MSTLYYESSISHHGIRGMKWGVRRYQDKNGHLTRAGKRRLNKIGKEMDADPEIPKMLSRIDEATANYNKSRAAMYDFLLDTKVSNKYIDDYVKKHPTYPDEPDYDRYEWQKALSFGGYDAPPYRKYAEDRGIDWKKQSEIYDKASKERRQALDDYTNALVEKYGNKSITDPNVYNVINHSIVGKALNMAREHKLRSKEVRTSK